MKTKNVSLYHPLGGTVCAGTILLMACSAQGQNLFVSAGNGNIYEYTPGGGQSTFASFSAPAGLAFDSAGDLFAGDNVNGDIYEYKAGIQTPTVFASGLPGVTGLAFNSAGNLFVGGGSADNTIYEYTPGGVQSVFATGVAAVEGLAFNSVGDLFVANSDGVSGITEITPGGVKSTLSITGLDEPGMLAFDSSGDLFIANNYGDNIIKYTPGGVQSTFASGLGQPFGIAFNNSGMLFEGDGSAGVIDELSPSGTESSFISESGVGGLGWMTVQGGPLPVPEPSVPGLIGAGAVAFLLCRHGRKQIAARV
jgi:WD40 repeat protein